MPNDLFIPATRRSPEISMSSKGTVRIRGRFIPFEPDEFFAPLFEWAEGYIREPAEETLIETAIEYINGTNYGKLRKLMLKLTEIIASGRKVAINYIYEIDDEQMLDIGMQWTELLKVPVNMIPVGKLDLPDMKGLPADGNKTQSAE